jgi:import inner membrane translocase subunit TIM44
VLAQSLRGLPSSSPAVATAAGWRAFSAATADGRLSARSIVAAAATATHVPRLHSSLRPDQLRHAPFSSSRGFLTSARLFKDAQRQQDPAGKAQEARQDGGDVKEDTATNGNKEAKTGGESAQGEQQQGEEGGKKDDDGTHNSEDNCKEDTKKKGEDLPPPPPHGDKTPWQVFRETMNAEFEKSKEWNDTTKAIASSAHEFTESESVRRARQAYLATSSAASDAVKTTAGAIGKGAVWTWETPVVKGVRKAANVTGDAVEKATRPIRETEAYRNVRDVIDDGSSSRYGGWVEKEERRKRREAELARQQQDPKAEVPQENPE